MTDSSERQIAFFGSIGFIAVLLFSYMLAFAGGWVSHSYYCDGHNPAPYHPYHPEPSPYPYTPDRDTWYTPPSSALRQLPRDPTDGVNRRGQVWRWEINDRGEYRFHRVAGDVDQLGAAPATIGQPPSGSSKK